MRSRGVSLPRAWWRSTYLGPPPASALACSVVDLGELGRHRRRGLGVGGRRRIEGGPQYRHDWYPSVLAASAVRISVVPPPMPEDAHVAVLAFDLGLGHVAHAAEQLHRLVGHPFAGLDGGVLGEAHLGDRGCWSLCLMSPARAAPEASCRSTRWWVYTRATSMRRAISASVFCTDCREISGRPKVSRSRHHCDGEVEAALRAGVGLRGQADPFGDERGGDLRETGVLAADQVGRRNPHVGVGQLGGVRGAPAHLVQLAGDLETRCALVDHDQRHPGRAGAAGARRGHDVVGAHPGGDVGLGAVDDVVVAVADRARSSGARRRSRRRVR